MSFQDTNSHLTTKPYNFDIKCPSNYESYDQHGFFGTKFREGQTFYYRGEFFFKERDYSGADWLVPLLCDKVSLLERLTLGPLDLFTKN